MLIELMCELGINPLLKTEIKIFMVALELKEMKDLFSRCENSNGLTNNKP